jgi:hypothetical protein
MTYCTEQPNSYKYLCMSHDFLKFAAKEEMLVYDVSWFRRTVRATMYLKHTSSDSFHIYRSQFLRKGLQPRIVLERGASIFGSLMLRNLLRPARSPYLGTMDG